MSDLPSDAEATAPAAQIMAMIVNITPPHGGSPIPMQVNTSDTLLDVRQFLADIGETCHITCYQLLHGTEVLNEYVELGAMEGITGNSVDLTMVEGVYDEFSARHHIQHVRSVLAAPPSYASAHNSAPITPSCLRSDSKSMQKLAEAASRQSDCLQHNDESSEVLSCLQSLIFSAFNPPPGQRRLSGDLLYLEAHTLESVTVHITAGTAGFYVNQTSEQTFNPAKSGPVCHDLVGLFKQISPLFRKRFVQLLTPKVPVHPYEVCPLPVPTWQWMSDITEHTANPNRAEDFLTTAYGADPRGLMRDWNEEYQSCRELPKSTLAERMTRDRMIYKVFMDYADAACKGAVAVVQKSIPAINPMEDTKAHVFVYNNIFFSYAVDGRDLLKSYGGDKAAHASSNNELLGVLAYDQADVEGLHTLATVVVSYRGQRLVAQSIIPGILHGEHVSTHLYGSVDYGETIAWDESFHQPMKEAAKILLLKEHTVKDSTGNEVQLCSPVECKGIRGSDGRQYILDVLRATVVDSNYDGPDAVMKILRPALLRSYTTHVRAGLIQEHQKKEIQAAENAAEAEAAPEAAPKAEEALLPQLEVLFNPNSLTPYHVLGSEDEVAQDEARVKDAARYLKETVIPKVVADFKAQHGVLSEGMSLGTFLHAYGVNMRYLGELAQLLSDAPQLQAAFILEMIARQAKHTLNACIREATDSCLAKVAAHFLNCLLGEASEALAIKNITGIADAKKHKGKQAVVPLGDSLITSSLTTCGLWSDLKARVLAAYAFEIPAGTRRSVPKLPLLSCVCKAVGLQITRRPYDLSLPKPFCSDDILDLFPVAKYNAPRSPNAQELLDSGNIFLRQGMYEIAAPLLNDALSVLYQVYGPMHRDTAQCYSHLALLNFQSKHFEDAISFQEKAVVILERLKGRDHCETGYAYEVLATLLQTAGKAQLASVAFERALSIANTVHGPNYFGLANIRCKAAQLIDEVDPAAALAFQSQACEIQAKVLGADHLQSLNCQHVLALFSAQNGQLRQGLDLERKVHAALKSKFGEKDIRTLESARWVQEFTSKAVNDERQQKKMLTEAGVSQQAAQDIVRQLSSNSNGNANDGQRVKGKKGSNNLESANGNAAPNKDSLNAATATIGAEEAKSFTEVTTKRRVNKKGNNKKGRS